jgi:glycosyltransferase involved in cell wall biosynthesis
LGVDSNGIHNDILLIGVVATNTPRKDWYLAFQVCRELLDRGQNVGLWAHTDAARKAWDIEALAREFGMTGRLMFSNRFLSDHEMAIAYSACDITLGIGSGEGWGYPLAESLACGVPVIHGDYAGGAEYVPGRMLVKPSFMRGEGIYGVLRPVFDPKDWADKVEEQVAASREMPYLVQLPYHIDWKRAWPEWERWLKEGVA